MPIHEYQCNRCADITEKLFKTLDVPSHISCPNEFCGGVARKILSKGSFVMLDEFGDSVNVGKK